jgi:hypothetical protein
MSYFYYEGMRLDADVLLSQFEETLSYIGTNLLSATDECLLGNIFEEFTFCLTGMWPNEKLDFLEKCNEITSLIKNKFVELRNLSLLLFSKHKSSNVETMANEIRGNVDWQKVFVLADEIKVLLKQKPLKYMDGSFFINGQLFWEKDILMEILDRTLSFANKKLLYASDNILEESIFEFSLFDIKERWPKDKLKFLVDHKVITTKTRSLFDEFVNLAQLLFDEKKSQNTGWTANEIKNDPRWKKVFELVAEINMELSKPNYLLPV